MSDQKDSKAGLMGQAESTIEKLLAVQPSSEEITLSDREGW